MAFNLFQGVETKKKKRTTTPVSTSKSGFNLFAPRGTTKAPDKEEPKPTQEKSLERTGLKNPRKLANGNVIYDKPSGGTLEYRPDGSYISRLPAHLGGGSYEAAPGGGLIGTAKDRQDKRSQDLLKTVPWGERDHIIPVSLGGTSARTNLRQVDKNPKDLETKLAEDVAAGRKTVNQARVEILTYKQNAFSAQPVKQGVKANLLSGFKDAISSIGKETVNAVKNVVPGVQQAKQSFDLFKKPQGQGQTFKVGENLTEQQKRTANLTLDRSSGIAQNEAFDRSGKADQMNLGKTVKDLLRATPRGIIQITQPTNTLEPLEQKYPKVFRFIYGDEKLTGYSRQAAEAETQFKKDGYGKLSTPLAVIAATGTAAMDLAPLYAPALRSINDEIASVAKNLGKKEVRLTFKDLQDITSGKLTSGEKFDAFKNVAKDIDIKKALKEGGLDIAKQEDTLLARMANNPITKLGEKAPTTYSVPENSIAAVKPKEFSVKQLEGKVEQPKPIVKVAEKPKTAPQQAIKPKAEESPLTTEARELRSITNGRIDTENLAKVKKDIDLAKNTDFEYKIGDTLRSGEKNYIVRGSYIENGKPVYEVYTPGKKNINAHQFIIRDKDISRSSPKIIEELKNFHKELESKGTIEYQGNEYVVGGLGQRINKLTGETTGVSTTLISPKIGVKDIRLSQDELYNLYKKSIPKADPLLSEARKYKSAEEFVKAQGKPVYHGTDNKFTEFDPKRIGNRDSGWYGKGFYFAGTKGEAGTYGKNVMESYVKMDKPFVFENFSSKVNKGYSDADTFYLSNIAKEVPLVGKKLEVTIYDKITENGRMGKNISLEDYIKQVEDTNIPYKKYEGDDFDIYEIDNPLTGRKEDIRFTKDRKFDKGELKHILFDKVYKTDSGAGGLYGVERKIADNIGDDFTDELKKLGYDGTMQSPDGDEWVAFKPEQIKTKSQLKDIWKEANKVEAPKSISKTLETPTKVAKTASDINKELVSRGFDSLPDEVLAKYTPDTKKRVMSEVSEIMEDMPKARAIISGAEDAPSNVKQVLFNSMEAYATKNNDISMLQELASSPIASELSASAQALGASGFNKNPDSVVQVLRRLTKERELAVEKRYGSVAKAKKTVKDQIKKEIVKSAPKAKDWASFIEELKCN